MNKKVFFLSFLYSVLWIYSTSYLVAKFVPIASAQLVESVKGLLYVVTASYLVAWYSQKEINIYSNTKKLINSKIFVTTLCYSVLWILITDYIVVEFLPPSSYFKFQTMKGTFYIFTFSLLVSWFAEREIILSRTLFPLTQSSQIGKFSSMLMHEVSNPLSIVNLLMERTKRNPTPENVQTLLKVGGDAISSLADVTKFFKAISNNRTLEEYEFDDEIEISDLIEATTKILLRINVSEIIFENKIDKGLKIKGSKSLVTHVIMNLVKNAIDYHQTSNLSAPKLTFFSIGKNDITKIVVSNSGEKLTEKQISGLFKLHTTKEAGKGSGYGLLICREIMNAHGGEITYLSDYHEPAFELSFPKEVKS